MSKNITAVLNNNCNRSCSYCYQKDYIKNTKAVFNDIFLDKLNKYLLYYKDEEIRLSIIGGEPLYDLDQFRIFINSLRRTDIDLTIYTNMDNYNEDLFFELSKFKSVEIYTELDLFQSKNVFLSKRFKNLEYLKRYTNFEVNGHILIFNTNHLKEYYSFIKRNINKLKEIGFKFSLLNISTNNYTLNDLKVIMQFYDLINEPELFNEKIKVIRHLLVNTIFDNYKSTAVSCDNCMNKTFFYDGTESKCTYSKLFPKSVDKTSTKCNECVFLNICDSCEDVSEDLKKKKCDFMRLVLELQYYLLSNTFEEDKRKFDNDNNYNFNISIDLGHICNLSCDFCYYHDNDISSLNVNEFKKFVINNFKNMNAIDAFVGGEPLLYLNKDYEFLFDYIENISVITNGTVENNFVRKNQDKFSITISIHNFSDLDKIKWDQFKTYDILLLLSESVCKNIIEIIRFLDRNKLKYRIIELYSYRFERRNENVYKLYKEELTQAYSYFKSFREAICKIKKYNHDCFENKLLIFDNKVVICGNYEILKYSYGNGDMFISDDLSNYIINKMNIIENLNKIMKINNLNINNKALCPAKILNLEDEYFIRKELIQNGK